MIEDLLLSDKVKLDILKYLEDGKWYSYYSVHKDVGVNFQALKKHLRFLTRLKLVEIQSISPEESGTGNPRYSVRITERGREALLGETCHD